jgi:hypothetical protein
MKKFILITIYLTIVFNLMSSVHLPILEVQAQQNYQPLAPIADFVPQSGVPTNNLNKYLNDMFRLGIAIAIALAVIMIIVGGIQYMSTDAIGKMNEGKKSIQAALTGLLVALAAYMIIKTLDPNMLSTRLGLDRDLSSLTGRIPVKVEMGENGEEYTHYNDNSVDVKYPDGTTHTFDNEADITSTTPQTPPPTPGKPLQEYTNECIETKDNSGRSVKINKESAYLRDNMGSLVPGTEVYSTGRSREHNRTIPGAAPNSQHTHGGAVDIWDNQGRTTGRMNAETAGRVINYIQQNAQQLNAYKIIFNNRLYSRDSNGNWSSKSGKYGHFNHVHVSLGKFCQ